MTPNINKTIVGLPLPPQLEEDPFPLSRRISYTRLIQMLPPPVETVPLPAPATMRSREADTITSTPWGKTLVLIALATVALVSWIGGGW